MFRQLPKLALGTAGIFSASYDGKGTTKQLEEFQQKYPEEPITKFT